MLAQKVNADIENVISELFGISAKVEFAETENYDIEKEVKKPMPKAMPKGRSKRPSSKKC